MLAMIMMIGKIIVISLMTVYSNKIRTKLNIFTIILFR